MGKRINRKHGRHYGQKFKRNKGIDTGSKGAISSQTTNTMPNIRNILKGHLHPTVSGLFAVLADSWWIPVLINHSFWAGYALFIVSNGLFLGWVIYLSIRWLYRRFHFTRFAKMVWIGSALVAFMVFLVFGSYPIFSIYFTSSQEGIEMPSFVNDSTPITIYYGNRAQPVFYTKTTVRELEQEGEQVALKINGQNIFTVHIENNRLYVDALVYAGIENEPIEVKNNHFSPPDGWGEPYQDKMNFEIDSPDGIPVLIMEYKSPYSIIISGLFVTPLGICKVSNEGAIYELGDTLSELGTYKVDRVFRHQFWDLFTGERSYVLQDEL